MLSVRNWFFSTVSVFPFWSTEAKWHIPSTKILNPLKQREGGKDSPNKLSRVNAWPTLISVSQQLPTWHFSGSVYKFIVSLFGMLFNAFSCSLYMGCLRSRCPTLHCQIWFTPHQRLNLGWGQIALVYGLCCNRQHNRRIHPHMCHSLHLSLSLHQHANGRLISSPFLWLSHTFLGHIFLEGWIY